MNLKCFIEIMKCKEYIKTEDINFGIIVKCKTEKTKQVIKKLIEKDEDIWMPYKECDIKNFRIYDINKIIKYFDKLWEKESKNTTNIYFDWRPHGNKICKEIAYQLARKNSIYELQWFAFQCENKIYNKKLIQEKKEKENKEKNEIDKFIENILE